MSSRTVSLTSTFLLLAAGGTAACDNDDDDATFYCADANGQVVDEDYCDDDDSYHPGLGYFIWYSSGYRTGYPIGHRLPSGGSKFAYNDAAARTRFGLPASGRISNGTIKTGVVGKGGSGSGKSTSKSGG